MTRVLDRCIPIYRIRLIIFFIGSYFLIPNLFASYFDEFYEAVDEIFGKIRNVSGFFEFSKMSRIQILK